MTADDTPQQLGRLIGELLRDVAGRVGAFHQSYRYQKLPGGDHTAPGDCRATLALLRKMAGDGD